jgi:hypothetical protein
VAVNPGNNCLPLPKVIRLTVFDPTPPFNFEFSGAFLGRLRAKYVTKGFLMLKPGLARLPTRVHASKERFLAGRVQ